MRSVNEIKIGKRITKEERESKILGFLSGILNSISNYYKKNIVYRLFWGRSNLYRNVIHASIISVTFLLFLTGFSNRFFASTQVESSISVDTLTSGNLDLLEQGGNIQSILLAETTQNFKIFNHKVKEGQSYEEIGEAYGVEAESIKLSNLDIINYYDSVPSAGTKLKIPEINGLLLKVGKEDTLNGVMGRITKGQELDIIEINGLKAPEYDLPDDQYILIPDGRINPPARPTPQPVFTPPPAAAPVPTPGNAVLAGVNFIDPLSHPGCGGYGYSRGFSSWHNGVDLTKRGGCPIRAAASGTVEFAGWSGGEGFMVRINHGNGVKTLYFHGDGQIWVSPGQYVSAGTDIMYMGCTGRCTGTHLHFSLKLNGYWIDPSPYVPYWRP